MDRKVGVRDAKARLSRILRDVQRGGEWLITDHGRPVARLTRPIPDLLPLEERVRRLEDKGWLEPLDHDPMPLPPPLPLEKGLTLRWLREDRDRDS
jgi:prevent-host-death family protein